jgi:acetyl esterase
MHSLSHDRLDPQIAAVLAAAASSGAAELHHLSPSEARVQYRDRLRAVAGRAPALWKVSDRSIPGPGGELTLRLYQPRASARPVLMFFHGGGWSFGDLDSHDHVCRWLCVYSDCVVAAVDYRLGPEHKFPAAVEDAIAATKWVAENGEIIGADASRIAVGGDSAGGDLAAVVALHARDTGAPVLRFQLLIYPAVDMTMSSPSHAEFGDGYRLTRPLMVWSCVNYLRDGRDMLDPRASPLFAKDHSRLPPALIVTAEFDPLRDEGKRYAEALAASGTPVIHRCEEGMIHGFVGFTGIVDRAGSALRHMGTSLSEALAPDTEEHRRELPRRH